MPPRVKYRVHPEDPRDLVCDTCPARYPYQDTPEQTAERARVRGWHVFEGPGLTGKMLKVACCPECFRTGAPPRPTGTPVLEGQMDLPGLITPLPVTKFKRARRQSA